MEAYFHLLADPAVYKKLIGEVETIFDTLVAFVNDIMDEGDFIKKFKDCCQSRSFP